MTLSPLYFALTEIEFNNYIAINTCGSLSKQSTCKPIGIRTYKGNNILDTLTNTILPKPFILRT